MKKRRILEANKEEEKEDFPMDVDVLMDILSRIPATSLARFKCVSKLWRSLICDRYFIDLHHDRARKANCIAILSCREEAAAGKSHLKLLLQDEACATKLQELIRWDSRKDVFITQPCNGFFCYYDTTGNIQLCNPTTRQILDLPKPINLEYDSNSSFYFGYHPGTKEFKILHVVSYTQRHLSDCEVFTLGTGMWRQIGPIGGTSRRGVTVNGTIYLLSSKMIVSFHLKDEMLEVILFPNYGGYTIRDQRNKSLVELEGSVGLVVTMYDASGLASIDMWMLKDNYVSHVWIHKHHVQLDPSPSILKPMFIQNGKMWLLSEKELYSHDLITGDGLRSEEVHHFKDIDSANVYAYVESLASLENP